MLYLYRKIEKIASSIEYLFFQIKTFIMKSFNLFLFVFWLIISQSLTGQTTYNYTNFKYPEVKVKGLNSELNLSGNDNSFKFFNSDLKRSNFSYNVLGSYFQFANSAKIQKTDNIRIFNSYARQVEVLSSTEETEKNFSLHLSKTQISRKYIDPNASFLGLSQKFFEFSHQIRASFQRYNINGAEGLNDTYFATVPVKIGIGRIEPMNDVFLAQFLMDDLLEAGVITEKFSEEKLFELAQLMSLIRNQRVFDFRRARIYQLTEIANWMEQNSIAQSIRSFAILNDNWLNASLIQRRHGKRMSAGLVPWLEKIVTINNEYPTFYGLALELEYINSIPLSQFSQSDFFVGFSQNFQKTDILENHITQLGMNYTYSYNPNSRTTYTMSAQADMILASFSDFGYSLNMPANIDYFINNRARIRFSLGAIFTNNPKNVSNRRISVTDFNNIYDNFRLLTPFSPILFSSSESFQLYGNIHFAYAFF